MRNNFLKISFIIIFLISLLRDSTANPENGWLMWESGSVRATNILLGTSKHELEKLRDTWGVNAVRVQVILPDEYLNRISYYGLDFFPVIKNQIIEILVAAESVGLSVIIDLHRPEGGAEGSSGQLWFSKELQNNLIRLWAKLAKDISGYRSLIGYDILNEPTPPDEFIKDYKQIKGTLQDWNLLAENIIFSIRSVDKDTPIIVECTDWSKPFRFENLSLFNDSRVVYSFHMYFPFEITHQGISQFPMSESLTYPGFVNGVYVDKEFLYSHMKNVVEFQSKFKVPIFVGEFGINKYSNENIRNSYVGDLINLFGRNKWSWAYHAYNIWDGWMPGQETISTLKKNR